MKNEDDGSPHLGATNTERYYMKGAVECGKVYNVQRELSASRGRIEENGS